MISWAMRAGLSCNLANGFRAMNRGCHLGEAKVFESDGFVVTTERFVYGSNVVPLDDISIAVPFINKGWAGMFIIGGIGLAMLAWGGSVSKFIGFLLLPGAYAFFHYTVTRQLILSMHAGESIKINMKTTPLLDSLVSAINDTKRRAKATKAESLRAELNSLPDAE